MEMQIYVVFGICSEKNENKYVKHEKHCKFRDHCHYASDCRGAAHRICNLKLKLPKKILVTFNKMDL